MRKTILFDLDGTLLPMDTDRFLRYYMKELAGFVGEIVEPAQLVEQVMASTYKMIESTDPALTNAQVFAADFFAKIGRSEAELMPLFDQFYRERFPLVKAACSDLPGRAHEVVAAAVEAGYEIVLATNPLFPREAIEERMRWIGVEEAPWLLVTTYEEMHACKPQVAYYQEVLAKIDRHPNQCIMVGNDVEEDGAAAKLGIDVYFVTDFLINRSGAPLDPDRSGSLSDLLQRLQLGTL